MQTYLTAYIAAIVIFLAIDALWLGVIAKNFMASQLGDLLKDQPNLAVAAGFYLLYAVGIVVFAIKPALAADNWHLALMYGALFGFMCYGTYDFTNWATIKNWPVPMVFVDVLWGTVLTGVTATLAYFVTQKLM